MGEKDTIFNPSITDDAISVNSGLPSGEIWQKVGPGVNVMRDADGDIIGLYDDLGNPIAQ